MSQGKGLEKHRAEAMFEMLWKTDLGVSDPQTRGPTLTGGT